MLEVIRAYPREQNQVGHLGETKLDMHLWVPSRVCIRNHQSVNEARWVGLAQGGIDSVDLSVPSRGFLAKPVVMKPTRPSQAKLFFLSTTPARFLRISLLPPSPLADFLPWCLEILPRSHSEVWLGSGLWPRVSVLGRKGRSRFGERDLSVPSRIGITKKERKKEVK